MALGDPAEIGHVPAGQQADRQLLALAGGPEPVERAVRPPALLVRLVEREAETQHARPLPPVPDDVLAVRALQVEMPEDAELVRMRLYRLDRLHIDRFAQCAGRMNDRGIDPRLGHLLQGVVDVIGRDLPVLRRHPRVFPEMDL